MSCFSVIKASTMLFLVLMLSIGQTTAQNLVPNPDFEEADICSRQNTRPGVINYQVLPRGWQSATSDSATAYYRCYFGNDPLFAPRSGEGMAHGYIYYVPSRNFDFRTFLQTRLTTPFALGCTYEVSFYIKPYGRRVIGGNYGENAVFAEGMGAYFSANRISEIGSFNSFLNYRPQIQQNFSITDTTSYTRISGTMIASGGEEYMTIGFFMPTLDIPFKLISRDTTMGNLSYAYSIEDVVVEQIPSAAVFKPLLPNDTLISVGNTIELSTGNPSTVWSTGAVGASIWVDRPGTYWARIEEGCFIYMDSIVVASDALVLHTPNAFTPNGDGLNDVFEVGIYGVTHFSATIYNRWGQAVYQQSGGPGMFRWDGTIHGKPAMLGVYVLQIATEGRHGPRQFTEKIQLLR